jgi:hypothetical protein
MTRAMLAPTVFRPQPNSYRRTAMKAPLAARAAAGFYALWGVAHVAGALYQLLTLQRSGGHGLAALIASAAPLDPAATIPGPAAAFMGMGAANIGVIGALVTAVAILNWHNSRVGYWLNLLIVAGVDLNLVGFLLLPGIMNWSDGVVGLALFLPAAILSTIAQLGGPLRSADAPVIRAA